MKNASVKPRDRFFTLHSSFCILLVVIGGLGCSKSADNSSPSGGTGASAAADSFPAGLDELGPADANGQCEVGLKYSQGEGVPQNYAKAMKWFRKAADQGHAEAQFKLGNMYYLSQGTPLDYVEAAKWLQKAADQGHAAAAYNMGALYDKGQGVPQDYGKAAEYYRKAADNRVPEALFNLGTMYALGQGVAQDYEQAYLWLSMATAAGLSSGDAERDKNVVPKMTPEQIAEAQKLVEEKKAVWAATEFLPSPTPAEGSPAPAQPQP